MNIKRQFLLIASPLILLLTAFAIHTSPDQAVSSRKYKLRILCYNIHHASPPSKPGSIDLGAIAQVINEQHPDLVALQEVDVFTNRSGPFNQAEELGKQTGMKAYFFRAIDHDGGQYGVAILSKFPVIETNLYSLPQAEGSPAEPRVLGTALIQISSQESILFATTHLDARRDSTDRLLQIKAIDDHLRNADVPVVLAGDFNAATGSEVIRILDSNFTRTCDPCAFTIPVTTPKRAIDCIAFSPATSFRIKKHVVIPERYASDHLPVFAELQISF